MEGKEQPFMSFYQRLMEMARHAAQKTGQTETESAKNIMTRMSGRTETAQKMSGDAKKFTEEARSGDTQEVLKADKKLEDSKYHVRLLGQANTSIRENTMAAQIAGDYPSWLASKELGFNPQEMKYSETAAELVANVIYLPNELRENPYVLYEVLRRADSSFNFQSATKEGIIEYKSVRSAVVRHINERVAVLAPTNPDVARDLNGMENDGVWGEKFDLYRSHRVEVPGSTPKPIKSQGESEGDYEKRLRPWIETENARYLHKRDLDGDLSVAQREIDSGRAINRKDEQSNIFEIEKKLKSGKFQRDSEENKIHYRKSQYDESDADMYLDRISERKKILEAEISNEYEKARAQQSFEGKTVTTADELTMNVEEYVMRYAGPRRVAIEQFNSLPTPEEKEAFKANMVKQIRNRMELLEENDSPWRIGGIEPLPNELHLELLILQGMDHELYEKIHVEAEARSWLHTIYQTLRKGASPQDTKELMHAMSEFDKMEFHKAVTEVPGVAEAFQELDKNYERIMAVETDPEKRKAILVEIENTLKGDSEISSKMKEGGISSRVAVNIAVRHFEETGRDAAWYRFYIRKHGLISYSTDENGITRGKVDQNAPLLWNPFRLLYCPEAMWTFFQFGANRAGEMQHFNVSDGMGGFKPMEMNAASGVGADVVKSLLDNNFDLCLQDFYSRRKGYILDAWIGEQLSEKVINGISDPILKSQAIEDRKIWTTNAVGISKNSPEEGKLKELQRHEVKLRLGTRFATEFGTNVFALGEQGGFTQDVGMFEKLLDKNRHTGLENAFEAVKTSFRTAIGKAENHDNAYMQQFRDMPEFQKQVNGVSVFDKEKFDYVYNSGEFLPTLGEYKINEIPYERVARLHENVRGNFRDHFSGLGVYQAVGDFINNPSVENFQKLDPSAMRTYTMYTNAQLRFILPSYLALCDVQRGKGAFGDEMFSLVETWKSKYSKVYDVQSMNDLDLYKVARWAVTKGNMSRDMIFKVRGKYAGLLRDKMLEYADPGSLMVLFVSLIESQAKELQKEMGSSGGGSHH
jgi:hypothetical protein